MPSIKNHPYSMSQDSITNTEVFSLINVSLKLRGILYGAFSKIELDWRRKGR